MTLTELLKQLDITIAPADHHHRTPSREQVECPYCSKDSGKFRMGIPIGGSYWCNCWVCGRKPLFATLKLLIPYHSRLNASNLADFLRLGVNPSFDADWSNSGHKPGVNRPSKCQVPEGLSELLPVHRQFLKRRRFDPDEIIDKWSIQGIGLCSSLPWRLFLPIFLDKRLMSWTTRSLSDKGLRYISAKPEQEIISHKSLIYGEDFCGNSIVIVEGPLDVWALGYGAGCTFGLSYTQEQLLRISKFARRVICFDAEPAAQRIAQKLCSELSVFPGETINVMMESGKDPSRASKRELTEFKKLFME
jgi:hypothetical protein